MADHERYLAAGVFKLLALTGTFDIDERAPNKACHYCGYVGFDVFCCNFFKVLGYPLTAKLLKSPTYTCPWCVRELWRLAELEVTHR